MAAHCRVKDWEAGCSEGRHDYHLAQLAPGEGQRLEPLLDVHHRLPVSSCGEVGQRLGYIILRAALWVGLQHAEHPGVPLLQGRKELSVKLHRPFMQIGTMQLS